MDNLAEIPAISPSPPTPLETVATVLAPIHAAEPAPKAEEPLSKSARKRLLKQEKWEAGKDARRAKKKEQRKTRKEERRELIAQGVLAPPPPRTDRFAGEQTDLTVVLDMSFDELMNDKEIVSIVSQVTRCYSFNRQAPRKAHLVATEFHGRAQARMQNVLTGSANWKDIRFETCSYLDLYPKERLVYLTADAETSLQTLDESKVYILGTFVDKNRHKGLTYKKATEQGITTAQLPIGEYLKMATRKVLTVNQVLEIMLGYLEHGSWEAAMKEFIPQRKLASAKSVAQADGSVTSTGSPGPDSLGVDACKGDDEDLVEPVEVSAGTEAESDGAAAPAPANQL
ncbi:tRNA (guanine(9)-N(1))-methyltransferase [Tieghemiomyces parasiticus]|uniref:tRNA (guanine(9)-N1)-methyltransferase n=1 Tax=Tieghemiomyces parasiticus TaxID=78921 RepID=A0A9W8AHU1_9FUNG|nr:tRNA (guanine(9)-N(1))-methyltransferase [Tieghemiomyces parasiticus]